METPSTKFLYSTLYLENTFHLADSSFYPYSKCGHIARSNRKTQSGFRCTKCNFTLNADLNAARNIVVKYLDSKSFFEACEFEGVEVNQPNVQPVFLGRPAKNKPLPSGRGY